MMWTLECSQLVVELQNKLEEYDLGAKMGGGV